ncbi:DUF4159 domain-containing protein [Gimesia algae]|uniref:DUF4159 domain-containing protein n=1 Tax=Gimesia algae TaxID=2527971 RepID=A0A517VL24_9PLAN|nr:DUF4159 domain-containing protein [Gimesia algae]QDT93655.1 hypothetical protein Pan161_53370 [Gimesia algae]
MIMKKYSGKSNQKWFGVMILLAVLVAWVAHGSAQNTNPPKEESSTTTSSAQSAGSSTENRNGITGSSLQRVPDPKQVGRESESIVQVANLVYAGVKSSQCFSDHFLVEVEKDSSISTSRRFHAVKLSSDELFNFPMVIMTGEGVFQLTDSERKNLRTYVERGGLLLASAGCSSGEWDRSFRKEMAVVFPEHPLSQIAMNHPVFNTVYEIKELVAKHGKPRPLNGVSYEGRLGVIYSQDGLNDTEHTQGCCCCGGNEITNCVQVNVNILAYSLIY